MLSGVIFGALVLLLWMGGIMLSCRVPRCQQCRTPLRSVGATMRPLGLYGVETVVHYACDDCDWSIRRQYICTHMS